MHRRSDGDGASAFMRSPTTKWRARVAANPFAFPAVAGSSDALTAAEEKTAHGGNDDNGDDIQWRDSAAFLRDADGGNSGRLVPATPLRLRGKENLAPRGRLAHVTSQRPPLAPPTPSKDAARKPQQFTVLGKRSLDVDPAADDGGDNSGEEAQRATGNATLVVNDFGSEPHVGFGRVAVSDRKTLQLTLVNPSDLGNARIKYDGYTLVQPVSDRHHHHHSEKTRFKCDLHVCVVPAEGSVLLRITFEPLEEDLERDVVAIMRFTVNDRYKLRCRLTGYGVARALKKSRFRGLGAFALPGLSNSTRSSTSEGVLQISSKPDDTSVDTQDSRQTGKSGRSTTRRSESSLSGLKRRESASLVMDMTPPRRPRTKRLRSERNDSDGAAAKQLELSLGESGAPGTGSFSGSWWSQRKIVYDENWMVKQEEGFTKWMNYVLLDSNTQRFMEEEAFDADLPAQQELSGVSALKGGPSRRRFDFSSLRVLAQKRIENSWTRSASEIYHTPAMDDIVFALQEEITKKKLAFRADRPVYADVGLQEELMALLNNYHPVWLRLGLEAVLGQKVMRDERCTLRSLFTTSAKKSAKSAKLPRALRRIVMQHLVHDTHVARKFRLVKNLKTPMDGSLGPSDVGTGRPKKNLFVNKKKNITGREYFDALMESFLLKFLMLIKFLDSAIESRVDKFMHFPCLFRVSPPATTKKAEEKDGAPVEKKIKCSQEIVSEFCRFFLSSEGRIDKHLKQLGYVLKHQQTPLDEIDVQIKNLAVDLRDGVRLAKLMEALTSQSSQVSAKPLSSFLRVPALSRLQKVHNVEICLHYLQEKCGQDVLESIKSATNVAVQAAKKSGRLSSASSSGFGSLQNQVDEKLVEKIAKDIVDGHREKTLALLWKLISCFQLQSLVDMDAIRREIDYIQQRMSFRALEFLEAQQQSAPVARGSDSPEDQVYTLLLEWCRVVCANYFVRVSDFTASFADGKALCYLLHYYHPMLLGKGDILPTTSDRSSSRSDSERLLANEKQHFMTVNERVKQLGEVPVLVPQHYHSQNPPEEKMVVTFVCYLQSRLMDSSREIHAASRLKRWWMSPWIRTQMRIKKNRSARIIQRFWFTSSQKRLAIRQCRRLLRAAHLVKSVMLMWSQRVRFTRLRDAASTIQRAFRTKRLRSSATKQVLEKAAVTIQACWRSYVEAKILRQKMEIEAARMRIAQRLKMKSSVARIEGCWIEHLQRRAARQYRKKLSAYQNVAAAKFQQAWQQSRSRQHARQLRTAMWKCEHKSASTIQNKWRKHQRRVSLFHRIYVTMCAEKIKCALRVNVKKRQKERAVALERFQQLLLEKELDKKRQSLRKRVEQRAARSIQNAARGFLFRKLQLGAAVAIQSVVRGFLLQKRFQFQRSQIVKLQRNVRIWRRNTHIRALLDFGCMLKAYKQQKQGQASQAAVVIQSAYRRFVQVREYRYRLYCVIKLQRNIRIWRFQRQVQALINFYEMLITYQHMQEDAREQQWLEFHAATRIQAVFRSYLQRQQVAGDVEKIVKLQRNIRVWRRNRQIKALLQFGDMLGAYKREKAERLQSLQWKVANRGAHVIQMAFGSFKDRKRATAATRIQACVRGWCVRRTRFDFYALKAQLARLRVFAACWRIEFWFASKLQRHKTRKALVVKARWVQLGAGLVQSRVASADRIAACWKAYKLRCAVSVKIARREEARRRVQQEMAASVLQKWWVDLCQKRHYRRVAAQERKRRMEEAAAAEARRQEVQRIQKEKAAAEARRQETLQIEKEEAAAKEEARRQEAVRIQKEKAAAAEEARRLEALHIQKEKAAAVAEEARRKEVLRVEKEREAAAVAEEARRQAQATLRIRERAKAVVAASVLHRVITPIRAKNYRRSVQRIQSWWRGMLVRLRQTSPEVTNKRKKISTMTLVAVDPPASSRELSNPPEQPLPLGARLEMALHLLLHGKRLPEMLFASHTIEVCTKYSRECCRRCVKLGISTTIFAAIRGLNRSRPHVELLHQLLLVLENLTNYQLWDRSNALPGTRLDKSAESVMEDVRAIEALVDLMHIHRDMQHIFALAARVLKFYVTEMQLHKHAFRRTASAVEIWQDSEKRLRGLYELLEKKVAVHAAIAIASKHLSTPSKATTSLANRMNPKVGMAILSQLLHLTE